jgi:O-antigen ligase
VSDALQVAGMIAATGLAAAALLLGSPARRWPALFAALGICFVLVAGQAWDGPLGHLRSHPAELFALALAGVVGLACLVFAFRRWEWALPLAALVSLPIRIPVHLGGDASNLLIPLYAVIAAGVIAALIDARGAGPRPLRAPRPLLGVLAAALALYAIQSTYSNDVEFAARNVAFFLVPFATLFVLLVETNWSPPLLRWSVALVVGEAVAFALVGIVQHQFGEIFWNEALEASNDFHFYFRANSFFWDPNIYGRYLSLAIVLALAVLAWTTDRRRALGLAATIAVIWVGLLFGFSQTSFMALLAGIVVLSALRWSLRWALIGAPVVAVAAVLAVVAGGSTTQTRSATESETSGHSTLIKGGLELAWNRPLYGYGSASFPIAFREQEDVRPGETTVSHNEPVTVAAEQGLVGVVAYLALLAAALWTLFAGMRSIAPGLGATRPTDGVAVELVAARIAIAAGFCALLVHTIGYAGYLSDPLTWTLIAIGSALATK